MRRHLPNTLHHTDCTRRTTAGRRNRYARAASRIGCGIANAPGAGQMNSSRRRCVTDLSLDGSAPVSLPPCRRARRSVRFFGSENSRPDTRFSPASAPYSYRPGCERPQPHGNRHDRHTPGESCSRNHVTTHESRLYDRSDRFPHRQWVRRPYRLARS